MTPINDFTAGKAPRRLAMLAVASAMIALSAAYILGTFEWQAVMQALSSAQPGWLLLGGGAAIVAFWATRALRWSYLMRGVESKPHFLDLYLCSSVALGLSIVTPLQSGEALKVELLAKYGNGPRLAGYSAFLIERIADLYVIAAIALVAIASSSGATLPATLYALAFLALPIAFFLGLRRLRLDGVSGAFVVSVQRAVGSVWELCVVLALTALGWVIIALGWHACLLGLPIRLDFAEVLALLSIVSLASIVSFVPAGLGIADASAAAMLIHYGVDLPLAQAGALLLRGFTPLVLALGAAHFAWLRIRVRALQARAQASSIAGTHYVDTV